jgi:hypothetical protein
VAVLFVMTVADCGLWAFAALGASDECDPPQPCRQADEITRVYAFAALTALIGLLLTFVLTRQSARPYQWAAAAAAMLGAAYPAIWLLTGNPKS